MRNEALRRDYDPVVELRGPIGESCVAPPMQLFAICEKNAELAMETHEMISMVCHSMLGTDRNPCPALEDSQHGIKPIVTDTGIILMSMKRMLEELLGEVSG